MKRFLWVVVAALGVPAATTAQRGLAVTPSIGAYVPAGSFRELQAAAEEQRREATLGLGLSLDFGGLRANLAYASGAKLTRDGDITGEDEIGEGSVLAATGTFVLRPLPRLLVQPYLLAGAGVKQSTYDFDDGVAGAFPDDDRDLTVHVGVGADLMFGRIGVMAEINDFISQNDMERWKVHDAFAFVGLKLRL